MNKIFCYMLGAGASCNSLPLVIDIPDRLKKFNKELTDWSEKMGYDSKKLCEATNWLIENVERHSTIDTFAKKLFIKNEFINLKILKAVTSCYFVYEQSKKQVDNRYDTLFASIINRNSDLKIKLPENIRFLSWNYDTQLEKAFFNYCDDETVVINEITGNKKVYRLNGFCGTHPPGHMGKAYRASLGNSVYNGLEETINLFSEYTKEHNTVPADINFAWEQNKEIFIRNCNTFLNEINILIIIGYSFPFFNREIDKIIFSQLKSLQKIYVQVPNDYHHAIKERLFSLKNELPEIIYLNDLSSFFIPYDYS